MASPAFFGGEQKERLHAGGEYSLDEMGAFHDRPALGAAQGGFLGELRPTLDLRIVLGADQAERFARMIRVILRYWRNRSGSAIAFQRSRNRSCW